jgi:hypothetical protein
MPEASRPMEAGDVTTVDVRKAALPRAPKSSVPPPTGSRSGAPLPSVLSGGATPAPSNVIPFTKPRAISALPVQFNKVGVSSDQVTSVHAPITNAPVQGSTWGSAAVAAAAHPLPPPPPSMPAPHAPFIPTFPPQQQRHAIVPPPMAPPQDLPPLEKPATTSDEFAQEAKTIYSPPPVMERQSKWAAFERLGLRAPKLDRQKWSGRVVNAYRALGFVILTIIVIVLIGYLITTAFFYMSNSWIVPMAISPTDEKVVSLQSQLAERQTTRDRTAAELDQAERAIAVQQEFQLEFAKAIKSDLEGRKAALKRMYELSSIAASTRAQIKRSNSAYASQQQKRMAEEWRAGLIDRDAMLNGKFQIAQINGSNLSLAERQAEYETRAADLDAQTRSLEALLSSTATEDALSYDVLKIKQEYEASRLETQRAIQNRDMLKSALEREDKLLESLEKSSYLKAIADEAHVAFVPYSNLEHVKKGEPVYGCWLTMVFCSKVGNVVDVLPGEVQFKHPTRDKMLRGQMVELKLEDEADATDDVLFVGGRPLLL